MAESPGTQSKMLSLLFCKKFFLTLCFPLLALFKAQNTFKNLTEWPVGTRQVQCCEKSRKTLHSSTFHWIWQYRPTIARVMTTIYSTYLFFRILFNLLALQKKKVIQPKNLLVKAIPAPTPSRKVSSSGQQWSPVAKCGGSKNSIFQYLSLA